MGPEEGAAQRCEARRQLEGGQGAVHLQRRFSRTLRGEHSELEERFIAIGPIRRGLVLVVYTERNEDTVRIISARWATKDERALFLEYMEERS